MSIPLRSLGKNGPQVPAVGLGLMSIGDVYGSAGTLEDKIAILEHAHATGNWFWDTADLYADSEDVVGEWVQRSGKRSDIFLATKFACQMEPGFRGMKIRSDPEYVKIACARSLQRLKVDVIDLYYCHRVDEITPIEKTVQAMVELKKYQVAPFTLHARFPHILLTSPLYLVRERSATLVSPKFRLRLCAVHMRFTQSLLCRWNIAHLH